MADTNVVSWFVNGEPVDLDLFDISGLEWRAAKHVTGLSQSGLLDAALREKDIEAIAAFVWIAAGRTGSDIDYLSVLASLNMRVLLPPEMADGA